MMNLAQDEANLTMEFSHGMKKTLALAVAVEDSGWVLVTGSRRAPC